MSTSAGPKTTSPSPGSTRSSPSSGSTTRSPTPTANPRSRTWGRTTRSRRAELLGGAVAARAGGEPAGTLERLVLDPRDAGEFTVDGVRVVEPPLTQGREPVGPHTALRQPRQF